MIIIDLMNKSVQEEQNVLRNDDVSFWRAQIDAYHCEGESLEEF